MKRPSVHLLDVGRVQGGQDEGSTLTMTQDSEEQGVGQDWGRLTITDSTHSFVLSTSFFSLVSIDYLGFLCWLVYRYIRLLNKATTSIGKSAKCDICISCPCLFLALLSLMASFFVSI